MPLVHPSVSTTVHSSHFPENLDSLIIRKKYYTKRNIGARGMRATVYRSVP